jgi:hypothetical protein
VSRVVFILSFFISCSVYTTACDYCGCFTGIMPYDNQSGISLAYRYKSFNGYASSNQSHEIFPDGSLRLAEPGGNSTFHHTGNPGEPLSPDEYEIYRAVDLHARYFIHERIELNFLLPFNSNKHIHPQAGESDALKGMGDLFLYAGYHLIRKPDAETFPQRLIIGGGAKLATGQNDFSKEGVRIHSELQPGTGSTDGFAFFNYVIGYHHWGANLYAMHKVNGTNKYNEKISNSTTSQFSLFRKFKKGKWFFIPSAQAAYEYTKGMKVNNELVEGTGANLLTAGGGIDIFFKNIGINGSFQLPVFESVSDDMISNSSRITIGISYSFNQTKYFFRKKNRD